MKELFKFAGAVVDSYDDPVFLDNANARSLMGTRFKMPEELDTLPDSEFAVKIAGRTKYQRRFPVYNEDITKVSCLYFENNYENLPPEIQSAAGKGLAEACDKYGLSKTASIRKHATESVAPVVHHVTHIPHEVNITEEDLTKMAEERLLYEMPKMALEHRTKAATTFYKAAGEDAVSRPEVWDYVEKPVVGRMLDRALDAREAIVKSASAVVRNTFTELRNQIENESEPKQVINALLTFDKYAGLNSRYRDGLTDPYRAVYGGWQLPKLRKLDELAEQEKLAAVVDGSTGEQVSADTAKGLSVEQHLFNLQKKYPKGTESFKKAAAAPASDDMLTKWGPNYVKARRLYFGQ